MNENEQQLLDRLKNNDEIAFKVIYTNYFSRLYYFIFEFIPVKDLAENIVQDTFFTLWNKRKELKDKVVVLFFTILSGFLCLYIKFHAKKYFSIKFTII